MIAPVVDGVDSRSVAELLRDVFGSRPVTIERVKQGVSTYVYRVRWGSDTFYLRILPEIGATLAPEVQVHAHLRAQGARVPEVLYFDPCHPAVGRSFMLTTAIRGRGIARRSPADVWGVLVAVGRDLAVINAVTVDGFGWIRRDGGADAALRGQFPSHRAWILRGLDCHLAILTRLFSDREIAAIRQVIFRYDAWLEIPGGRLAHGDFLPRHVFECHGQYRGIIDFSAIQGAGRLHDLASLLMYDRGSDLLPPVLAGYHQVTELPPDLPKRLCFQALLLAIGPLARDIAHGAASAMGHPAYSAVVRAISTLGRET